MTTTPILSVDNVVVGEGDGFAEFAVRLSAPSDQTVNYLTPFGMANSGDFSFVFPSPPTFLPGQTVQAVRVALTDDNVVEPESAALFNPIGQLTGRRSSQACFR